MNEQEINRRFNELKAILLEWQNNQGYWEGRLSSSALAVAVSITAFHFNDPIAHAESIGKGITWLNDHINADGGFGDTPDSISNISTSLLCYASLYVNRNVFEESIPVLEKISEYLVKQGIDVHSAQVAKTILAHYKNDRTFSVPILTMCALCGIPSQDAFESIPQLPFELARLPRSFYRMLNLSVVSYAIPALVAVGIALFKQKKKKKCAIKNNS